MENRNEFEYGAVDEAFEKRVKHAVNLREREQIMSFLDKVETEFQTENNAEKVVVRSMLSRRWMGIAASLLFLAAAFFAFQNFSGISGDQLVADYYEPFPNSVRPITRSQVVEVDLEIQAFLMYENGQYKEALVYLEQLPETSDDIRMFKAISKFETGDLVGSKADLKMLIDKKGKLADAAQWYMGMAFAKEGALDKAKSYFEAIAKLPSSAYQRDAKSILEKLK